MPSFDIISEINSQEVDNALNSAKRELENRYDFKGSKSTISREKDDIALVADDDMKLKALQDMIKTYLTRRNVDIKCLEFKTPEKGSHMTIKQLVKIKKGIDQDNAKKIVKAIKEEKMKIEASIQGEKVRITGKKKDDLQAVMQFVKSLPVELPLQFDNFRD
ncbi:MAG TPA: YajQ family cyclic di-GMP-binding protein [Alphaproteobacteria bacterium]|nr:YajQ family cyclic di-GMP-binding protein [Alphaproteobacteria bacterium]